MLRACVLLAAAACSSSAVTVAREGESEAEAEEGACPLSACGGDPTGSWTSGDACFESPIPCMSARTGVRVDGSLELRGDGTYSAALATNASVELPPNCLPPSAGCEGSARSIAGPLRWQCGADGSQCACTGTGGLTATGTWSVTDTTLALVPDAGGANEDDSFCVQGSTMTLRRPDGTVPVLMR